MIQSKIRANLQLQYMAPYVPLLVPELQLALVDPLPAVRATAAKAMGSLLRGMGEASFQGLLPWLLDTMKSDVCDLQRLPSQELLQGRIIMPAITKRICWTMIALRLHASMGVPHKIQCAWAHLVPCQRAWFVLV